MKQDYESKIIPIKLHLNQEGRLEYMINETEKISESNFKKAIGKPVIVPSYVGINHINIDETICKNIKGIIIKSGAENIINKILEQHNNKIHIGYLVGDIMSYNSQIHTYKENKEIQNIITRDNTVLISCQLYDFEK